MENEKGLLDKMLDAMSRPCPDEIGRFTGVRVGIGNKGLEMPGEKYEKQPLSSKDGFLIMVYEGAVYNCDGIKEELIQKGYKFETGSESEVIMKAYEESGPDCLKNFNGAFVFAVWDKRQERLFIARDRLGIKPLYYAYYAGKFVFSSDIKSILRAEGISGELDYDSIDNYLKFRYVPGPGTMFKAVRKFPQGCYAIWEKGNLNFEKYWEVRYKEDRSMDEEECLEEFTSLLYNSVKLRLSDSLPAGAFLSGGLDSSTLVGIMSKISPGRVRTFSLGFGSSIDELSSARLVSNYLGTEHTEIQFSPDKMDLLEEVVGVMEDPLGDAIIVPVYLLSQLAGKSVRMAFTGDGGDETLGGYMQQAYLLQADRITGGLTGPAITGLLYHMARLLPVSFLNHFFQYPSSMGKLGKDRLLNFITRMHSRSDGYLFFCSLFTEEERSMLYSDMLWNELSKGDGAIESTVKELLEDRNFSYIDNLLTLEFRRWLPDNILTKQEKMNMAASVQGRFPFLDHNLVEFTMRIPSKLRFRNGKNKYLERRLLATMLPREIADRKKQAFYVPVEGEYKEKLFSLVDEYLSEGSVKKRALFNYNFIGNMTRDIDSSTLLRSKQLMALIVLEIWFRKFID